MSVLTGEDSPREELGSYFDTIWKDTVGYVYLPTLDRKLGKDGFSKFMYKWPEHREHAINHVLSKNALGLDVYVSPAIYHTAKPIKENVLGSWVCWADYDDSEPREWAPESATVGTEALVAPVPSPTMRVQSGSDNHVHAYWELSKFSDPAFVEATNRSITYATRGDLNGWNINKVLRPPSTRNHKTVNSTPVSVSHHSGITYSQSRFTLIAPVKQLVSDSIDTDNLPTVELCIAKYSWDENFFKMFMDSNPENFKGKRSDALMRVGYTCAEMGMSDMEMYALLDNADRRWKKYVGRHDRKAVLLDILNRARIKHPTALANIAFDGLLGKVEQDTQLIYNWDEFLNSDVTVEWAIENLLEVGGYGIVASSPGVGKTQFSLQLAIACALGIPFLNYKPVKAMRITVLSLEMSHAALKLFMATMNKRYSEDEYKMLTDNLSIIPLGQQTALDQKDTRELIHTILEDTKPEGVIIDSLAKLSGKALDELTAKTLNNEIGIIRKKFNCFVWVIHHNRKANADNKRPTNQGDVYGNQYIVAEATSVLILYKESVTSTEIEVYTAKLRLQGEPAMYIINRDKDLYFTVQDPRLKFDNNPAILITKEDQADGRANLNI